MNTGILKQVNSGSMLVVLLLMAQFQFWDGIMTQVFVNSGLVKEANHLVVPLLMQGNFLAFKLLGIAAMLGLLWLLHTRLPRIAFATASCIAMLYLTVITWNFTVLFSTAL